MKHAAFALVGLVLSGLVACSEPASETTSNLLSSRAQFQIEGQLPTGWTIEYQGETGHRTVHQEVAPEAITSIPLPGVFEIAVGFIGLSRDANPDSPPHSLHDSNGDYKFVPMEGELFDAEYLNSPDGLPAGTYTTFGGKLFCKAFTPEKPVAMDYSAQINPQLDPQGNPYIYQGSEAFEAFAVLPGESVSLGALEWQAGAELVFDLGAHGLETAAPSALSIFVDGTLISQLPLVPQYVPARAFQRVKLPPNPGGSEVRLAVEGTTATAIVLAPTISRAPTDRPDFTIFLADTFRADNLAIYGGDPLVAPEMNAFADQSARFEAAWAPASWTLPSHASLFTSLLPPHHGATFDTARLDERYQTLAEVLHAAGWRTVAITEGGYVIPGHGLAQGFERFIAGPPRDIEATIRCIQSELERQDGRPLFLFVQSFRAHSPYDVTPAALAQLPHLFGPSPSPENWTYYGIIDTIERATPGSLDLFYGNGKLPPEALAHPELKRFEQLYRGGAADTSRGFGSFLSLLDDHNLQDANVILTSDHGEAFGAHGITGHANSAYQDCIHIPLLMRLPGHQPGQVEAPASLIDLAPTLLEIADLAPPLAWQGSSLVPALTGSNQTHQVFSYESPSGSAQLPAEAALRQGNHKVLASFDPATGQIQGPIRSFDLATDPGETAPLDDAPWSAGLAAQLRLAIEARPAPLFAPAINSLDPAERARLKALGYLGDD